LELKTDRRSQKTSCKGASWHLHPFGNGNPGKDQDRDDSRDQTGRGHGHDHDRDDRGRDYRDRDDLGGRGVLGHEIGYASSPEVGREQRQRDDLPCEAVSRDIENKSRNQGKFDTCSEARRSAKLDTHHTSHGSEFPELPVRQQVALELAIRQLVAMALAEWRGTQQS